MSLPLTRTEHPWMARFAKKPLPEIEALLGGYAQVAPYARLDPSTVLVTLFKDFGPDHPDRSLLDLLDATLQDFVAERRRETPSVRKEYGLGSYVRELAELFLAVRDLRLETAIKAWAEDFSALSAWLEPLRAGDGADARLAYWHMLAHHPDLAGMPTESLKGHWVRVCAQVGSGDLSEGYLDAALDALSILPDAMAVTGSPLLAGFSRWARELRNSDGNRDLFQIVWSGLTSAYPFSAADWAARAYPYLNSRDFAKCPAADWWAEALGVEPVRHPTGALARVLREKLQAETETFLADFGKGDFSAIRKVRDDFVPRSEAFADTTGEVRAHSLNMNQLGQALLDHDPLLTLQLVESSLDREPFNAHQYGLWARALMRLGRGDAAVKVLWQGIAIDPARVENYTILATALIRLGRHGEAEALYRETMRLFPDNAHARTALAKLLADNGRIGEAEAQYRELVKEFPKNPVCRLDLGLLLLEYRPDREAEQEVERLIAELRAMKHTAARTLQVYLDRHRGGEPFRRGDGEREEEQESGPLAPGELPEGLLAAADVRRAEFLLGGALDDPGLLLMTPEDRNRLRAEAVETLNRLLAADPTNPALLLIARRYKNKVPALDVADADIVALADTTPVLAIAARRFGLLERDYTAVRTRWPNLSPLADWAEVLDHDGRPTAAAGTLAHWIRTTDPKRTIPALGRLHAELIRLCRRPAQAMDADVLSALVADNPDGLDDLLDLCLLASIEVTVERRLLHFAA